MFDRDHPRPSPGLGTQLHFTGEQLRWSLALDLVNFERMRRRGSALLYAFDLLELDGRDLRREPIGARKAVLAKLLNNVNASPGITYIEHINGDAVEAFAHACRLGYEGIVCKRASSPYRSGRSTRLGLKSRIRRALQPDDSIAWKR